MAKETRTFIFDLRNLDPEIYTNTMKEIRTYLRAKTIEVDGVEMEVLPIEEGAPTWLFVDIRNLEGEAVMFCINRLNIYVVGFLKDDRWLEMPLNNKKINLINKSKLLSVGGSYNQLQDKGGFGALNEIEFTRTTLSAAVSFIKGCDINLENFDKQFASKIVLLIIFISESCRFKHITREICKVLEKDSDVKLVASATLVLFRSWKSISQNLINVAASAAESKRKAKGKSKNKFITEVSQVREEILKMGILKGLNKSITEVSQVREEILKMGILKGCQVTVPLPSPSIQQRNAWRFIQ